MRFGVIAVICAEIRIAFTAEYPSMQTIINFCPTGMIPTKDMTPHVPISPAEIVEQTQEAYELGITIVHLHARTSDGAPTQNVSVYQAIIDGIRKHCPGLIVCASTSGRLSPEFEKRSEVIELKPDMCSLTLSSLNFPKSASVNSPDTIQALLGKMQEYGVHPELECFDLGMINYGKYLLKKFGINGPQYWNVIFGNIAGLQASLGQIDMATREIPDNHYIGIGGIGQSQLKAVSIALAGGLGVRVGLEDNIWQDQERTKLATNMSLLKRVHALMQLNERTLMPSEKLGLYNQKND